MLISVWIRREKPETLAGAVNQQKGSWPRSGKLAPSSLSSETDEQARGGKMLTPDADAT